jgi:hypothetical protein
MSDKLLLSAEDITQLKRNDPNFSERGQGLADKLDSLQKGKIQSIVVGAEGINQLIAFTYDVTTGAADIKIFDGDTPFKFEIVDVIIQSRGTDGTGTLKITNGANDITDAMTCAVDKTMARAGTIDDAYSTIAKNGTVQIACAGGTVANVKALVTVLAIAKD